MNDTSEYQLLLRFYEDNDSEALLELERRFEPGINKQLAGVQQVSDREDIQQMFRLNLFRLGHTYKPYWPLAAWLNRVMANTIRRYYRHSRSKSYVPTETNPDTDRTLHRPVDEVLIHKETSQRCQTALTHLPHTQSDILRAHYLQGESVRDYARRNGIPLPTAKSRRERGLQRLRALLK